MIADKSRKVAIFPNISPGWPRSSCSLHWTRGDLDWPMSKHEPQPIRAQHQVTWLVLTNQVRGHSHQWEPTIDINFFSSEKSIYLALVLTSQYSNTNQGVCGGYSLHNFDLEFQNLLTALQLFIKLDIKGESRLMIQMMSDMRWHCYICYPAHLIVSAAQYLFLLFRFRQTHLMLHIWDRYILTVSVQ